MIALALLCAALVALVFVLLIRGKNDREALMLTLAAHQEALLQKAASETKEATRQVLSSENTHLRMELSDRFNTLTNSQRDELMQFSQLVTQMGQATTETNTQMRQEMTINLAALTDSIKKELAEVRSTMNAQIETMRAGNEKKLDQMRMTVEEKLQSTLETRLTESFKQVAAQLKEVETGLGEMRHLAGQVGELKRVLTTVKTRGTFGEMQLGAILEDILTPEQYEANVATRPNSRDRVEFAIKLPGQNDQGFVWLPIDAKFPIEDWQRLEEARVANDLDGIEAAAKALETRLKGEAKKIHEKYVEVPYTTEFAVLFLPSEALYAECLRRPGLAQFVQNTYRVTIAGPTVLASLLNSLQMGFRTLAIQKRSAEVWEILSKVKAEFEKFTKVIDQIDKQVETVKNSIASVRTRTNVMSRNLRNVESLPGDENSITMLLDNKGE
ncbi:MAG: DNA recombination protein RmuC [Burkholderiaceae bacterium]|nr:DNA recombination protein RmuC [Burkholderiaceae bacterium]